MSSDKTVILITGSNTGLGYETVKSLLKNPSSPPYRIFMAGRTLSKVEEAIQKLGSEVPDAKTKHVLESVVIDVDSDESIQKAFEEVKGRTDRIDILVNNAGANYGYAYQTGKMTERESWNKAYDTNVTGTYLVTMAFAPLYLASKAARIVFIPSGTASCTEATDPKLPMNRSAPAGWPKDLKMSVTSYRTSKVGMNMMFLEIARLFANDGVKCIAASPGFLATGLGGTGMDLRKVGAGEPEQGANFVRDVIQGKHDEHFGKVVRQSGVQPW